MLEAIAVQVGQAGATPRQPPPSLPYQEPPVPARGPLYRDGTVGRAERPTRVPGDPALNRSADPARPGSPTGLPTGSPTGSPTGASNPGEKPGVIDKPGLIDKRGLLSAQAEETEEERQRRKDPEGLTEEERAIVKELKARDKEVRAHEQAHARVGGQYAGSPTYQFETGPDGKRYAVSGQVKIDVSPVRGDPEATIRKMVQVKKAALAPAEPSAQDRAVASKADAVKAEARAELFQLRAEEQREAREEKDEKAQEAQDGKSAPDTSAPDGPESNLSGSNLSGSSLSGSNAPGSSEPESGDATRGGGIEEGRGVGSDGRRLAEALAAYASAANANRSFGDAVDGFDGAADATKVLRLVA